MSEEKNRVDSERQKRYNFKSKKENRQREKEINTGEKEAQSMIWCYSEYR